MASITASLLKMGLLKRAAARSRAGADGVEETPGRLKYSVGASLPSSQFLETEEFSQGMGSL